MPRYAIVSENIWDTIESYSSFFRSDQELKCQLNSKSVWCCCCCDRVKKCIIRFSQSRNRLTNFDKGRHSPTHTHTHTMRLGKKKTATDEKKVADGEEGHEVDYDSEASGSSVDSKGNKKKRGLFGSKKTKKPRDEYVAEINELKWQLAQTKTELESTKQELEIANKNYSNLANWAKSCPV